VTTAPGNEQRRAARKPVGSRAPVMDVIRDQPMGHLGNLSATGLLLIGTHAPRRDAVYQVRLPLPGPDARASTIEVGIQAQWHEPAASPGQVWAGYRIIAITSNDATRLEHWLQQH
jgi:hypothetical protein